MSEDVVQANPIEEDDEYPQSDSESDDSDSEDSDSDSDWSPEDHEEEEVVPKPKILILNWKEFISMGMRCKLSNRQISNMNNALMVDLEEEDERKYLTPSKVRRLKIKYGLHLAKKHQETMTNLEVIAFDGKSSKIAKEHCQTEVEDKTSVTCGVTFKYLDHFIVFPSTGWLIGFNLFKVQLNYLFLNSYCLQSHAQSTFYFERSDTVKQSEFNFFCLVRSKMVNFTTKLPIFLQFYSMVEVNF